MKELDLGPIENANFDQPQLPEEVLRWIAQNNLWNIWVPEQFGGLELKLIQGLEVQQELARFDGSLGWTQTLCSGANFFIGNLKEEILEETFGSYGNWSCFGGSGMPWGSAHKEGDHYRISGKWKFATGAPHLTHFTLNAHIFENGKQVLGGDGKPVISSFLLTRHQVQIIQDWNTMGLKATASHSFSVEEQLVHQRYGFHYNDRYLPHPIFKIPFPLFADLTLWVNYLGMAEHFLLEAQLVRPQVGGNLSQLLEATNRELYQFAGEVEIALEKGASISDKRIEEIHAAGARSIRSITSEIIKVYPSLGIRACSEGHPLNKIFRDYFTATQHANFV